MHIDIISWLQNKRVNKYQQVLTLVHYVMSDVNYYNVLHDNKNRNFGIQISFNKMSVSEQERNIYKIMLYYYPYIKISYVKIVEKTMYLEFVYPDHSKYEITYKM